MTTQDIFESSLHGVRVADLRAYLVGRGWKAESFPRREELKFSAPAAARLPDGASLLIPASEELLDYSERVEQVVRSLSVLEGRLVSDVLWDVLAPTCDKLNVRLKAADTRTGTLALGFATEFFSNVKNLLTFAACAEMDSRRHIPRAFKDAVMFANRCRLARTSPGSFQVTIESPLPPPVSEKQRQTRAYPKQRRILQCLMSSLQGIRRAHDLGQVETFIAAPELRLNANICDALLGMRPDSDDAVLELRAVWNRAWPEPTHPGDRGVCFDNRAFETVAAIGDALRAYQDGGPTMLFGKVVRLSAESPPDIENGAKSVTIRTENLSRPMHVEISVNRTDYQQAILAHQAGKTVGAQGVLERKGRKAMLLEPSHFRVLDE